MACAVRVVTNQLSNECAQQETKLAVLWTIGVFALNFGPVIVGGVLDYVGPKLVSIAGKLLAAQCNLPLEAPLALLADLIQHLVLPCVCTHAVHLLHHIGNNDWNASCLPYSVLLLTSRRQDQVTKQASLSLCRV